MRQPEQDPTPPAADATVPASADLHTLSLALLALAATVFLLAYAWEILLPVALAALASYALDPVVNWLVRCRIPRALGAALVIGALVAATGLGISSLQDDALAILQDLPASTQKLRQSIRKLRGEKGAVQSLSTAVAELEKTAQAGAGSAPVTPGVTRVQIEGKPLDLGQYLWWGSMGVIGFGARVIMVVFLAFFLLASGDLFRRKLVRIAGPTLSRQRLTVQILNEITTQIERFLFVQMLTCLLVGFVSAVAFQWIGLERAWFWGVVAGLLNSIPYFGPLLVMGGVGAVAFLQFGSLEASLKVAAVSLVVTALEGFLLTPWLLGRRLRMNGVAVFVGLLFWGWIWGVWGVLLAMPMMVVLKSVCDHVESLHGLGELLGE